MVKIMRKTVLYMTSLLLLGCLGWILVHAACTVPQAKNIFKDKNMLLVLLTGGLFLLLLFMKLADLSCSWSKKTLLKGTAAVFLLLLVLQLLYLYYVRYWVGYDNLLILDEAWHMQESGHISPDFYDFYFGYLYETMLSAITYQLGQNQLDVLMDFMKEPGLLPMSKYRVIEAVAHIVITHPDRREEVMDWFGNLLSYYFDVLKEQKNDICSTLLLDHVTACMMDIRGVETLPILQKIYRTYHIKPYGIPSINELKKKMPYAEMHGLEMERVEDYLVEVFEVATDEEEDEEIYDDPLYMEDQPAKKFRIKIELKDSEPLVWRILEVPSNICLERFSEVVEVAMGWDGYHLHRFIKGNTYYLPPKDRADDCFFEGVPKQFDSGMLSLGELLSRKGSKIKYEYDFGDSWIHEIILESCQSYKKEEIPVIALLDGENACPPEDCNGIWGYRKMLKALEKPRSKAAREYKEWLGYNFDPTEFDLDETRGLLAEIVD